MKRILPIVLVLALVAAAVIYLLKQRENGALDLPKGRAAELAPADTLVFVELPDVPRSLQRWKETSIYKISEEPEWREFTAKWGEFTTQNAGAKEFFGVIGEIQRADPAGLFLAMSSFDDKGPKFVGGFPYRGKRSDVQLVVGKLREQLIKSSPTLKSELVKHVGTEIETLTDTNFTAVLAYAENWLFFGSDLDLLKGTLSRHAGKAPAGLSTVPLFIETVKQGSPEPDMTVYVSWKPILEKIQTMQAAINPRASKMPDPYGTEAILYTAKMDGLLMRDRIYTRMASPPKIAATPDRSLVFSSAATYAYAFLNAGDAERVVTAMLKDPDVEDVQKKADEALAPKGLKFLDIFAAFGPEVAMLSDWEPGGISLPTFFAAVEVRDAAKARLFAELIAEQMKDGDKLVKKEDGGTTFWSLTTSVPFAQPTLGINEKHMVFGLSYSTAAAALRQLKAGAGNLSGSSAFQSSLKTVPPPTVGLLYVDFKTLFDRLYEKFKPSLAFTLLDNPDVAKYFDGAKLPKAETISRHLLPLALTYGPAEQGYVAEGAGSLSLIQTYVPAVGGMAGFFFYSRVKSMQIAAPPASASPPRVLNPQSQGDKIKDANPTGSAK